MIRRRGLEGGQQVAEVAVAAFRRVTVATTVMSPRLICSAATCIIQLSPATSSTVTAVPDTATSCRMGRM